MPEGSWPAAAFHQGPAAIPSNTSTITEHAINTKRKALAAISCTALIAAASTACLPSRHDSAATKVKKAFAALGSQHAMSAEIRLDATADQIYAAMRDQKDFKRADADTLADLRLSYALSYDMPLKDARNDDSGTGSFALSRAGHKPMLEMRSAGKTLYARADLKDLSQLGRSHGDDDQNDTDVAGLDQLVKKADTLPPSMDSVKTALKGGWVYLDPTAYQDEPAEDDQLDAKTQKQVLETLEKALDGNVSFKNTGKVNGADHVKVTLPAKKTAKDITDGLKPLTDKLGGRVDRMTDDLDDIPDKDISVDVALRDGKVSSLTLDLAQLDRKVKDKLPLTIAIKGGATKIDIPTDAKPLTPGDVMAAAMLTHRSDETKALSRMQA
ncbi:hypothetical protein ACX9I7_00720 [Streptomyces sp. L500]